MKGEGDDVQWFLKVFMQKNEKITQVCKKM